MKTRFDKRDWIVWECLDEDGPCPRWAAPDGAVYKHCPMCHAEAVRAGYTLGELSDAENRFCLDTRSPVLVPEPPPLELVQLSKLPERMWVGLPVFHPGAQDGGQPDWFTMDIGIVYEVFGDGRYGPGERRCRFVHACADSPGSLNYSADNLWVPKVLADRLMMGNLEKLGEVAYLLEGEDGSQ